jgi:hypothetical protein
MEPFNESAAQVKRLINRDRKELLGNKEDILDKYETEFGDSKAQQQTPPAASPFSSAGGYCRQSPCTYSWLALNLPHQFLRHTQRLLS